MNSVTDDWALPQPGSPIRASSDRCLLAAPRGLSQLATPFIASRRQGIHRSPLVAWPQTDGEHRLATLENLRIRFSKIGASKTRTRSVVYSPLVEMTGFEPATPCLQSRCSPN